MAPKTYSMLVNGKEQILTHDDSILALRRDYTELLQAFNPALIRIEHFSPPPGSGTLLKITVDVSKYRSGGLYYLDSHGFSTPTEVSKLCFYVNVLYGYPATKPVVYYPANRRNCHINVYSPDQTIKDLSDAVVCHCHGDWGHTSSLFTLVRKVVLSIIHDESVAGYNSPATRTPELIRWQRTMARKGAFPAINPALIYPPPPPPRRR